VQVLGSGGPDLVPGRAQTGYLVWIDGKARVLIDAGGGTILRLAESGADVNDLDVVLLTHLHADHTADLASLVQAAVLGKRARPLPVYGPSGNRFASSTVAFVRALLDGTRGAYRDLGDVLRPLADAGFKLQPHDVREARKIGSRRGEQATAIEVHAGATFRADAVPVIHGVYPALAWRIRTGNSTFVFTGDTNGEGGGLERFAEGADLLVAHHAVPERAAGVARYLHMPPSVIGRIAGRAQVKRLVLSHRTRLTLGREAETAAAIQAAYSGPVIPADDLACFAP
jgi:ribonuclease BN (tRNA processing enzyme)